MVLRGGRSNEQSGKTPVIGNLMMDESQDMIDPNLETPLLMCPDMCILTNSRACQVDKINHHKRERQEWVGVASAVPILGWRLMETANHCTAV